MLGGACVTRPRERFPHKVSPSTLPPALGGRGGPDAFPYFNVGSVDLAADRFEEVWMFTCYRSLHRLILTAGAGALLLAGVPGRAAVPVPAPTVPAARHSAPPTAAAGRATTVPIEFDLPASHTLVGFPRLRVVN